MEWDESQTFPVELFHQLGEMGFMGIVIPEEYGGSGLSYHEYVAILDEISQVDPSIGLSVAAHNSLCTNHIYEFGNEEQRKNGSRNSLLVKLSELGGLLNTIQVLMLEV